MSASAPPRAAEIDLGALADNLRAVEPEILDLRADAYGHGLERVLRTAADIGRVPERVILSPEGPGSLPADLLRGLRTASAEEAAEAVAPGAVLGTDGAATPVMSLRAEIIMRKPIGAGEGVSYGFTYRPERDTVLALVAIGYSQGVARRASNRCDAVAAGERCRIAGAISMDLLSVDIRDLDAQVGDRVELFGPGSPVAGWSAATGIPALALTSRIQSSVPRIEVRR